MKVSLRRACAALLLVIFLFGTPPRRARADGFTGLLVGFVAAVVVVSAGVTIGIVYAVRHKPSLTGCAAGGNGDLALEDEHSHKRYQLTGDLAQLTAGQRVKVAGKKIEGKAGTPGFRVLRVEKNFGACPAMVAQP